MSNYALQSQVNQLERELNQIRAVNAALHSEIVTITNGVSQADNQLRDYNSFIQGTLENCNEIMGSSSDRVIRAYELQFEIEKLYLRFKNIELANKKIRACNNKRYYEFSNYRTVRKIVQGLMDNLDVNMVSDQAITKSIEVQHLQVPDYWLTCVLISIMAWKNDDRELAERAMERAVRLDKKNSSIFYMIFNLRLSRDEAALKWFSTYQQCDLKGSDQRTFLMLFSLVSKTINDKVDEETSTEIFDFIKRVIMNNATDGVYSEESAIAVIRSYLNSMKSNESLEYSLLKKCCSEYNSLADTMMSAKKNANILEFILRTINVTVEQKNEYLKTYIDGLISTPNQAEKDVYEEIAYNEMIIDFQGDIEAAKIQYDAHSKKEADDLNLIAEMIEWIYERENQDINGQIKLNMFTLTKDLFEKAVKGHVEDYRNRSKNNLKVQINDYSTQVDFKDESKEKQKLNAYYTERRDNDLAKIKDWKAYIGFGAAAAAAIGAFFVGYWMFVLTVVGAGYGAFILFTNKSSRKQLEFYCQDSIRSSSEILHKLFSEYEQFIEEYTEYDELYDRIMDEINNI
jgi:hypothetical protein